MVACPKSTQIKFQNKVITQFQPKLQMPVLYKNVPNIVDDPNSIINGEPKGLNIKLP